MSRRILHLRKNYPVSSHGDLKAITWLEAKGPYKLTGDCQGSTLPYFGCVLQNLDTLPRPMAKGLALPA